jgi:hypothetical protein
MLNAIRVVGQIIRIGSVILSNLALIHLVCTVGVSLVLGGGVFYWTYSRGMSDKEARWRSDIN